MTTEQVAKLSDVALLNRWKRLFRRYKPKDRLSNAERERYLALTREMARRGLLT